eukprot:5722413-Amphidinium_carterae.1
MADRLGWVPDEDGWPVQGQSFSWEEAALKAKVLCASVASKRAGFDGLASDLSTSASKQLKFNGQSQREERKAALNVALGGVWHKARAHSAFQVGDLGATSDVSLVLIASLQAPPRVRLHGLLPAPEIVPLPTHEFALVQRHGVVIAWTNGPGRHSSN